MRIQLTPEQERRIRSMVDRGAYESPEEVVDAALIAIEERTIPGFDGTQEELDSLLAEGLASGEMSESEFWTSLKKQTSEMMQEYKHGRGK